MIDLINKEKILRRIILIICSCIVSIGVIITTNAEWWFDQAAARSVFEVIFIFSKWCIVLVIGLFMLRFHFFSSSKILFKVLGSMMCIVFFLLTDPEKYLSSSYLYIYIYFLPCMIIFFSMLEDKKIFWNSYINIVLLIAVSSLFFYVFGSTLHLIKPFKMTSNSWGPWGAETKNYYYIYYESHKLYINKELGTYLVRNTSFFTEGPMFNLILCIALGADVFIIGDPEKAKEKKRLIGLLIRRIVLAITILTTITTTGQLFLLIIILVKFLQYMQNKLKFTKLHWTLIILLGLIAIAGVLLAKMVTGSGAGSTSVRTDHLIGSLRAWWNNKIFGWGYINKEEIYQFISYDQGMSVGFPYMLACGGIVFGSVFLIPFFNNCIICIKNKEFNELIFEVLFFMLHTLTIIFARPIFALITAYMISYDVCPERSIEPKEDILQS